MKNKSPAETRTFPRPRRASVLTTCAAFIIVITACVFTAGCSALGYRLGSTLPPGIHTVYVPTFINRTTEPQLEADTTRETIDHLQLDGNLRVVGQSEADTILEVTLIKLEQNPIRFHKDSAKSAEEYRLVITASVTFTRKDTGQKLMDKHQVRGKATFEFVGDMTSSKREAIPDAARDLAKHLVATVVEYW